MSNLVVNEPVVDVKRPIPFVPLLFSFIGIGFAISAGLGQSPAAHAVMAIGAGIAAFVCWPWKARSREFALSENGLKLNDADQVLAWDMLVRANYGNYCCSPDLVPDDGQRSVTAVFGKRAIVLRSTAELPSGRLYKLLWNVILSGHVPNLKGLLRAHYESSSQKYPAEKVTAGAMVPLDVSSAPTVSFPVVMAFFVFAASCYVAMAFVNQPSPIHLSATFISSFLTLILFGIWLVDRTRKRKPAVSDGGIVITPKGLALRNKELKGEMTWQELKQINLLVSPQRPKLIRLKLEGAQILLTDEFQLPLWYLFERIQLAIREYRSEEMPADIFPTLPPETVTDAVNPYRPPRMT